MGIKKCEKKKEDMKEESFANLIENFSFANFIEIFSFANLVETSSFVKKIGYAITTGHGPTYHSSIHGWIAYANASEHMTNQRDWFSSLKMTEPNTWGANLANIQKLWAHGVGIIHVNYLVSGKWLKHVLEGVLYMPFLKKFIFSIGQATNKGFITTYKKNTYFLTDVKGEGKVVMTRIKSCKLYKL